MTKPLTQFADYTNAVLDAMESIDQTVLANIVGLFEDAFFQMRKIYVCGNGGSAAIANHLTCDCMKGVACDSARGETLNVTSLACNVPLITAIANDIGYDDVFSSQVEWQGNRWDILIAISSSGNSPNILKAINKAKDKGMKSIAITGFDGGKAAELADYSLHIKSDNYGVIEDVSQSIMHYIAQSLRRTLSSKKPEEIKY